MPQIVVIDKETEDGKLRFRVKAERRVAGTAPRDYQISYDCTTARWIALDLHVFEHVEDDIWETVGTYNQYNRLNEAVIRLLMDVEGIDEAHIEAKLAEAERLADKSKEAAGA